jgi:hypothetical protein
VVSGSMNKRQSMGPPLSTLDLFPLRLISDIAKILISYTRAILDAIGLKMD